MRGAVVANVFLTNLLIAFPLGWLSLPCRPMKYDTAAGTSWKGQCTRRLSGTRPRSGVAGHVNSIRPRTQRKILVRRSL